MILNKTVKTMIPIIEQNYSSWMHHIYGRSESISTFKSQFKALRTQSVINITLWILLRVYTPKNVESFNNKIKFHLRRA